MDIQVTEDSLEPSLLTKRAGYESPDRLSEPDVTMEESPSKLQKFVEAFSQQVVKPPSTGKGNKHKNKNKGMVEMDPNV